MQPKATLYLRYTKQPYSKIEFKNHKPVVPSDYEGAFYLRLSENGKRVWRSFSSLQVALTQQENFETNLNRLRKGLEPLLTAPALDDADKGTITAAVAEFVAYSESRENDWRNGADNGLSPNSVVAYRKAVEDFAAACADFGAVQMSEFQNAERGEAILLNFKHWLHSNVTRKRGKAAYSDVRKFVIVSQFLARNGIKMKTDRTFNPQDAGLVDHADVPRVKKPGIADVVYYVPADIQAMLNAANGTYDPRSNHRADDLKDLIFVLLCTGMRDEEVQHLCWSDINWANGDGRMKITVQDKPQYDWRVKDHEKRIVAADKNAVLKARLRARQEGRGDRVKRAGSELIFPTSAGTPDQNFADRIGALQARAETGKKPYTFSRPEARTHILHNFRKSYATYQMLHGVPVRNIQRDLGHSDLSTTERYLAVIDEPAAVLNAYGAIK